MKPPPPDYSVDAGQSPGTWLLRGVMRLESPEAYARAFEPVVASLTKLPAISIDLSQVVFLNSSGIRALADVLLLAREKRCQVTLFGSAAVPWQKKLASSLTALFPEFVMRVDR
jgi:hypothetical protein